MSNVAQIVPIHESLHGADIVASTYSEDGRSFLIKLSRHLRDVGSFPIAGASPGCPEPKRQILIGEIRNIDVPAPYGGSGELQVGTLLHTSARPLAI